jgi:hypothetical protein
MAEADNTSSPKTPIEELSAVERDELTRLVQSYETRGVPRYMWFKLGWPGQEKFARAWHWAERQAAAPSAPEAKQAEQSPAPEATAPEPRQVEASDPPQRQTSSPQASAPTPVPEPMPSATSPEPTPPATSPEPTPLRPVWEPTLKKKQHRVTKQERVITYILGERYPPHGLVPNGIAKDLVIDQVEARWNDTCHQLFENKRLNLPDRRTIGKHVQLRTIRAMLIALICKRARR